MLEATHCHLLRAVFAAHSDRKVEPFFARRPQGRAGSEFAVCVSPSLPLAARPSLHGAGHAFSLVTASCHRAAVRLSLLGCANLRLGREDFARVGRADPR